MSLLEAKAKRNKDFNTKVIILKDMSLYNIHRFLIELNLFFGHKA